MAERIQDLQQCVAIATVIAHALRSGASLVTAVALAVQNAKGNMAEVLQKRLARVELGEVLSSALAPGPQEPAVLAELLEKLRVANKLGTAAAEQLEEAIKSWHARAEALAIQRAARAESRMLIPLVFLILPVTVIFALYPSLQLLNLKGI